MQREIIFTKPITPLMLEPDLSGELADEALHGMAGTVVGEAKGMLRVKTRYRYEGYAAADSLMEARPEAAAEWEKAAAFTVIAPSADIMSKTSFQSAILATLPRGALLSVNGPAGSQGSADEWAEAAAADGTRGYVRRRSVRAVRTWSGPEEVLRANVAADARLYMGTQYRWGGKTPFGIDCSGIVSMAYMLNGLYIFRDARIVEGFPVREIPREKARQADLLFWKGHVAMYLGNGRYIHSTGASSGVVMNSLNPEDEDYREDLAEVSRWGSVF